MFVYYRLGDNNEAILDPPIPNRSIDAADMWHNGGFKFELIKVISKNLLPEGTKEVSTKFKVWAKIKQSVPGVGGDGGAGGIGGYAGIVHAIGLKQMPNFSIFNNQGTFY